MSRGNFPVIVSKWLNKNKSLLYPNWWGIPTKWERMSANPTILLESWYFIVGFDRILDSYGDMKSWGCPRLLSKVLQVALNIDPEQPRHWIDVLAALFNEVLISLIFSSIDSELLSNEDRNILFNSDRSMASPANSSCSVWAGVDHWVLLEQDAHGQWYLISWLPCLPSKVILSENILESTHPESFSLEIPHSRKGLVFFLL